ncbi:Uncharacterized protein BM_BM1387 [Brugia malayi]|uniref:Bm1387 n=1 Tax=Brugia malayi TaxID=6279 RepID=A0A0K0IZC3_BRUMA|nr:Uncharacterized protein BM_BM1387 [Brugia malayi]CDP97345.1 Bm1387 [Brugia malayi]VIO92850.1 Uncharacterized protein BM_BM1387 [Brugia malayi]
MCSRNFGLLIKIFFTLKRIRLLRTGAAGFVSGMVFKGNLRLICSRTEEMQSHQLPNIISITGLAVTTTLSILASLIIATSPVLLIHLLSRQPISKTPTKKDIQRINKLELALEVIKEEMAEKRRSLFSKGRLQLQRIIRTIQMEYINLNYAI